MGDMTLADCRAEVRLDLDNRSVADIPNDRVDRWLNWTLHHVTNPKVFMHPRLRVGENVTLVTGTNQYPLLGDTGDREVWLVLGVRNVQALVGNPLYPKSRKWFRRHVQDIQGRPSYYMHTSTPAAFSVLQIYNAPSVEYNGQILRVEEYCKHEAWTTDHVLETMWDEVLVAGGIWRGWRGMNQPVFADRALTDYAAMINEIREREGLEAIEDPRAFDLDVGGHGAPMASRYGRR